MACRIFAIAFSPKSASSYPDPSHSKQFSTIGTP
jgi:hypothetical protein